MAFSKTFPRTLPGNNYPLWEEIFLTSEEERQVEQHFKQDNFSIMNQCLEDARILAIKNGINSDENRAKIAIALFEKQASHLVFWKESKAKEKFDRKFK
jgi:hypothetical protein